MSKSQSYQGKANGRSEDVAALLTAARAVLENRAFADAARAILVACKAILGADGGLVAVSAAGEKGFKVSCFDPGSLEVRGDPLPVANPVLGVVAL